MKNESYWYPDEKSEIKHIKERIAKHSELEKKLMKAGPNWAEKHIEDQEKIQEYYYGDVMELLETMENVVYQLERLEPLLEMPEKGYVRNNFNAILRTLKGL